MNPEQLPSEVQPKLQNVLDAIRHALNQQKDSPHTRAISFSRLSGDAPFVQDGGDIMAPGKPQFDDYDERALKLLYRDFLMAAEEVYQVIVKAERPDENAEWSVTAKLVSRNEQRAIEQARKPIDVEAEAVLRKIPIAGRLEFLTFGRGARGEARLGLSVQGADYQLLAVPPELMELLTRADKIYAAAGLRLQSCDWTLRPAGFEYEEYFE